ncbi:tetratricopeptide repeat protein [Leptothrix discophora]|uniref:Tetratricopeptide repeat protein n=1 Tax=Leptothrix discophora TaxID=89 RepID=A0ABT9G6V0_LEPDI|nr:tetratricopeptide repeat protein [Leptothrix discophora]MDP4302218.1 tetratricopeptide repeat protein [Leptothrix discophora]
MLKSLWREVAGRRGTAQTGVDPAGQLAALAPGLRHAEADERARGRQAVQDLLAAHLAPSIQADGHALLGDEALAQGRLAEAEASYRTALSARPEHARAQEGLGLTLLQARRLDDAFLHLEMAHRLDPMNADILVHWGLVELEMGNYELASTRFARAIERAPANPHAWLNLGLASFKLGQFPISVSQLERSVELRPDLALAWSNLALARRQVDDLDGAMTAARTALALRPNQSRLSVILGDLLADAGEFEASDAAFARAESLDPSSAQVAIGRGKLRMSQGRLTESETAFRLAMARDPANPECAGGLGQLLLLQGRWAEGWEHYEARRRTVPGPVRHVPAADWSGHPQRGERLLVHAEQGLGDIILFGTCLPDLVEAGVDCVIDLPARLAPLFRRSFPEATICPDDGRRNGDAWLASLPPFDRHVPMGTLPRWLRQGDAQFPSHARGYLRADPLAVARWREQLADLPGPRIGLSWRGGLLATAGRQRSLSLVSMLEGLRHTGANFVCLQYGDVGRDLAEAEAATGIRVHPGLSGYGDLDDMAALNGALDGIVTVCSTQAHLCGALGLDASVLVPVNPNWRYGASGSRMAWYPSLTLMRQTDAGEWSAVLAQAAQAIAQRCGSRGS